MPNTCTPSSTSSPACSPYLFPPVEAMLREAQDDLLAFAAFPIDHWKKIWSTNPLEVLRLAGAVLVGATTNGR
jgi:hypothetical protein